MARHEIARHKIMTTDAEIDRAIEHAKSMQSEPRVTEVEYRPDRVWTCSSSSSKMATGM